MRWKNIGGLKTRTERTKMLCCGRRKENGRSVPDLTASPGRVPPGPMPVNQNSILQKGGVKEPVMLQGDFRKVSGISSEIFRQIESVENDHDPSTAAALESVERRGEMIVRILEPRCIGGRQSVEAAQKFLQKGDARHIVQLVEIVKRPGQTLGLYIREGNGHDRIDGVFISRIALESAVYNSGCLRVGDEILAVNLVDVTKMSLDDVVIIMSIPRRLVLAIRQRRGGRGTNSPGPPITRQEHKPPPVVVIKRDLRDDELEEAERLGTRRSTRERRTGDGREMTESRSRLGLGLTSYSPQSEQIDLFYNTRPGGQVETPSWSYKPPAPPPTVITEQPKGGHFQASYYKNRGTLESLAEKVHQFYPGPGRRMSGSNVPMSQSHTRFPRSGSDQHLPRVEYGDYPTLTRQALLRSGLKTAQPTIGGTLGRYGRYDASRSMKYTPSTLSRRSRPTIDYSSDTEATISGSRTNLYYYNKLALGPPSRVGNAMSPADFAKFNSLPRDRPTSTRLGLRSRLNDRLSDESDGNLSAPEYSLPLRRDRGSKQPLQGLAKLLNDPNLADLRSRLNASPSIFTSDEYRAWLRRAPSSSAICDQMRLSRDLLNQQRAHRFSCSAENIHDALKNTDHLYTQRAALTGTLDRHSLGSHGLSSLPVRSLSSQHIGSTSSIRSPSVRRIRQLLELGPGNPASPVSLGGHQSPAPTPSTTLPRQQQRQIDINPAEFSKYKLDRPVLDATGISGMLWIHLLAGRGLRAIPEGSTAAQAQIRDLYCVLECDRVHKARTVVRAGDLQFDWDESFELDLVSNKQLDVLVYSWDPQHRHKLCYRGAISLTTILKQTPIHQLALKVEPRGTIYVRLRHTDPAQLYKRRGVPTLRGPSLPSLFGVDLETVVTREAKGTPSTAPVPIILRRCVEEVERRGLDIIGLYRLCGSATKKRLLREAFERNSRAVELSPEHVPDINVITGVLKDYLRELPEPLFTKCLFQMTVDALGVCLPDDPDGNAKLMLSILDYLPRANRATLVFLLDHLSLVVSASERNKMSAQALATALGPPLMLHSISTQPGEEVDHSQPIAVLKYLLQIWPQPQNSNVSGRRARVDEPAGMRGNKANALQAAKPLPSLLITPLHNQSIKDQLQRLATPNSRQSQSVVVPSAQSPQVSRLLVRLPHPLVDSVGLEVHAQSPQRQPIIPSPSSSSSSTGSTSGTGTDTVKRGASPAASLSSDATTKNDSLQSSNNGGRNLSHNMTSEKEKDNNGVENSMNVAKKKYLTQSNNGVQVSFNSTKVPDSSSSIDLTNQFSSPSISTATLASGLSGNSKIKLNNIIQSSNNIRIVHGPSTTSYSHRIQQSVDHNNEHSNATSKKNNVSTLDNQDISNNARSCNLKSTPIFSIQNNSNVDSSNIKAATIYTTANNKGTGESSSPPFSNNLLSTQTNIPSFCKNPLEISYTSYARNDLTDLKPNTSIDLLQSDNNVTRTDSTRNNLSTDQKSMHSSLSYSGSYTSVSLPISTSSIPFISTTSTHSLLNSGNQANPHIGSFSTFPRFSSYSYNISSTKSLSKSTTGNDSHVLEYVSTNPFLNPFLNAPQENLENITYSKAEKLENEDLK